MDTTPVRSAQRVVEVIELAGVRYVFGIPGAKIDAVFDALLDGTAELVVCRHEQNAAFMASAIGRLTGTPGVVLVTSGPGTTNLATGLLTANTEQDPVVAICGAVARRRPAQAHPPVDGRGRLARHCHQIHRRGRRPRQCCRDRRQRLPSRCHRTTWSRRSRVTRRCARRADCGGASRPDAPVPPLAARTRPRSARAAE